MSEASQECASMTNFTTCPTPTGYRLTADGYRYTSCRRLACGYCGPRLALSTAIAIRQSTPRGSAVVTLKEPPAEDRPRLRAFARVLGRVAADLRADGYEWEYVWVVELSESLMPHVHVLQRGSQIAPLRFRRALAKAGGQGNLQSIRHPKILSRYVLKLPMVGLDRPDLDAARAMDLHLRLNGGKLLHSTRGFWTDTSGARLSGVREARKSARIEARGIPTGRRPTTDELERWRSGWRLPPISEVDDGSSGGAVGLGSRSPKG
jgi:hypothetical protein